MPEKMCQLVGKYQADLGIALDGDADRVIFSDAKGKVVDGDRIIGMLALEQARRNALPGNRIVVTSMSNLALHQAMEKAGIKVITTDVGDHLVIEAMRKHRCSIGGEQSGHVIFMDHVTTGDGIITALHIMKLMQEKQKTLAALADFMTPFPQKTVNLQVSAKPPLADLTALNRELEMFQKENGSAGRTVIRYSGTENKLRILVETEDISRLEKWSSRLSAAARCDLENKK